MDNTHNAPRKGLNFVMLWKVGMNHKPPIPTTSINILCQTFKLVSSPLYGKVFHTMSTLSGSILPNMNTGKAHATKQGNSSDMEKFVAVTAFLFHKNKKHHLDILQIMNRSKEKISYLLLEFVELNYYSLFSSIPYLVDVNSIVLPSTFIILYK